MVVALVWSESPEPNATGLKDCTYSAGLSALVGGGFTKFPLGIYTVAEREALERSDAQPNETGASLDDLIVAVKKRYGIDWHKSSIALLAQHHSRNDLLFIIQGKNGNLPAGHSLRRWDPTYIGGHAVTIQPTGNGTSVRWLDPEAPMKYNGDIVAWTTVMKWIGTSDYSITVRVNDYAPPPPVEPPVYTETQMKAMKDQLAKVQADLLNSQQSTKDAINRATAAEVRLANIKAAGGW